MSSETTPMESFRESIEWVLAGDPVGLFNAANDTSRLRRRQIAEVLYRMAIDRGVDDARLNLGRLLLDAGRTSESDEVFTSASDHGDVGAAFMLAQSLETRGDLDAAREHYVRAIALEATPVRLARVLRGLGRDAEAATVIREAVERSHEAAVEWVQSTQRPALVDAIALLERHRSIGNVDVLIALAQLYANSGDYDAEVLALRESVGHGEPYAFYNLAITLLERPGGKKEARRLMKRGAKLGDTYAKRWLARHPKGRRRTTRNR